MGTWRQSRGTNQVSTSAEGARASQLALPTDLLPSPWLPPPGTNVCAVDNGGCQQLCLYRGNGQRALRLRPRDVAEDGSVVSPSTRATCSTQRTILKSVHLSDERNLNAPGAALRGPEHMKNVIALAFDWRAPPGAPPTASSSATSTLGTSADQWQTARAGPPLWRVSPDFVSSPGIRGGEGRPRLQGRDAMDAS